MSRAREPPVSICSQFFPRFGSPAYHEGSVFFRGAGFGGHPGDAPLTVWLSTKEASSTKYFWCRRGGGGELHLSPGEVAGPQAGVVRERGQADSTRPFVAGVCPYRKQIFREERGAGGHGVRGGGGSRVWVKPRPPDAAVHHGRFYVPAAGSTGLRLPVSPKVA